jgi:hypothetical protein
MDYLSGKRPSLRHPYGGGVPRGSGAVKPLVSAKVDVIVIIYHDGYSKTYLL